MPHSSRDSLRPSSSLPVSAADSCVSNSLPARVKASDKYSLGTSDSAISEIVPRSSAAPDLDLPYVTVALDRAQSSIDRELTYDVPPHLRAQMQIGVAVLVPAGRNNVTGYVTGWTQTLEFEAKHLRSVVQALGDAPVFDAGALQVARWMSAYYHCPLNECLSCYIPQGAQQENEKRYAFAAPDADIALRSLARSPRQLQVAQMLLKSEGPRSRRDLEKAFDGANLGETLKKLVAEGIASEADTLLDASVKPRVVQAVRLSPEALLCETPPDELETAAPKQAAALRRLLELHAAKIASSKLETQRLDSPGAVRQFAPHERPHMSTHAAPISSRDDSRTSDTLFVSTHAAAQSDAANRNDERTVRGQNANRDSPDSSDGFAIPHLAPLFPTALLARDWKIELAALRGLEKKGFVEFASLEQDRTPIPHMPPRDTGAHRLTDEQRHAVDEIEAALQARVEPRNGASGDHASGATAHDATAHDATAHDATAHDATAHDATAQIGKKRLKGKSQSPSVVLLQGVTASGKTEVYLHAIERCLAMGRRALVLVPEIALTAQTVEIFQRRFQERVAILHSALGAGERFDEWRRARAGRADIVVGARSAIFAPCRDVGLIVIDEEHDHSYKQDASPRYHARDVALRRAAQEGAVVVLGSATPSLESWHRASRGDFKLIKMTKRIGTRTMPHVEIVDMTSEAKMGALPVLSAKLKDALCETTARGEQSIVFLNRRGFAIYVQCLGCGHVERCPNCDVTLTFHRSEKLLRCHHCDHAAPVIEECPECQGWMIGFTGTGTEKVESEVAALLAQRGLGDTQILRLDRDTTGRKGAHGKILGEFREGRAQILIGTQMVTKGLDFPNVTLVGVVNADSALNMPDFRAAERTFQLLAQVSGRAGRGTQPGRVLVQSLAVDHYAIVAARDNDYEGFVKQEMEFRSSPPYPPFSHVVNIISQDEDEKTARTRLESLAVEFSEAIQRESGDSDNPTELLGPVDCPVSRVKNKFRFHLMLRDRNRPRLHRVLEVYDRLSREARSGLIVDVDAMSLL